MSCISTALLPASLVKSIHVEAQISANAFCYRGHRARPQQLYAYGDPSPDIAALAASRAYGIAKNHPFVDGNKRIAAVLCELFIMVNGVSLEVGDQEMLSVFLALAGGSLNENQLADWIT